jgi:hypothetical protein
MNAAQLEETRVRLECDSAIERLYEVFGAYRFRQSMPCCVPHCFDQAEIDALGMRPLRDLDPDELHRFARQLLLTCGETQDFKYFLPRLLELIVRTRPEFVDAQIIVGKLPTAAWHTWSSVERAAVNASLEAWWRLELHRDDITLEDCLAALCCSGNDPRAYLRFWRDLEPTRYAVMLARFVNRHLTTILAGRSFNVFVSAQSTRDIAAFLREPETRQRFESAFHTTRNQNDLKVLSLAEQLVRF